MPPLYQVHDNLDHDNKPYAPGDEVELTKDAAAPLLELRVVSGPKKAAAGGEKKPAGDAGKAAKEKS